MGLLVPTAAAQILKLPVPDTSRGTFFGVAVAIDGTRALVGASSEDACGAGSGAAYLYEYKEDTQSWALEARLEASDCAPGMYFGRALDLSGDVALVASTREFFSTARTNAAYVFERNPATGTWEEVAKLQADPARQEGTFATSIALDGGRALVTTSGDATDGQFHGAAYVFERDSETGRWRQSARLTSGRDLKYGVFGSAGVLEGDRVAVAASTYFAEQPGSVYVFERNGEGTWDEAAHLRGIEDFFIDVALSGDRVMIGQSRAGRRKSGEAVVYERTPSGRWERDATLEPPTPYAFGAFGSLVALDGPVALVAGYDEQLRLDFNIDRVVYAYALDPETGTWRYRRIFDIGQVAFGTAIDHDGTFGIIGQASEQEVGAAYIVRLP